VEQRAVSGVRGFFPDLLDSSIGATVNTADSPRNLQPLEKTRRARGRSRALMRWPFVVYSRAIEEWPSEVIRGGAGSPLTEQGL
jgi:hypothetical protein